MLFKVVHAAICEENYDAPVAIVVPYVEAGGSSRVLTRSTVVP